MCGTWRKCPVVLDRRAKGKHLNEPFPKVKREVCE